MKYKEILINLIFIFIIISFFSCKKYDYNTNIKNNSNLTIYSSHNEDIANLIIKEFEEKYGIFVNFTYDGTGVILNRIKEEKSNPQCDVIWGGGMESLYAYKDFFQSYTTASDKYIPDSLKDRDRLYTGFTYMIIVIAYNTNVVTSNEIPKSWVDLTDSKWKGKIACADPYISGSAYSGIATILDVFGRENGKGWDVLRGIIENLDGKILTSSIDVFEGISDGNFSIGITYEQVVLDIRRKGGPIQLVFPLEGTSAIADGSALIKGAKNLENAKLFLDFVVEKETQAVLSNNILRRSVRNDVVNKNMIDINKVKLIDYDYAWYGNKKEEILEKWRTINNEYNQYYKK